MSRCNPPDCLRPIAHKGECRPSYRSGVTVCAAPMKSHTTCARGTGHKGTHRSRWAMDHELGWTPIYVVRPPLALLGPAPCRGCRTPLYYGHSQNSKVERTSACWREIEGQRHQCRRSA